MQKPQTCLATVLHKLSAELFGEPFFGEPWGIERIIPRVLSCCLAQRRHMSQWSVASACGSKKNIMRLEFFIIIIIVTCIRSIIIPKLRAWVQAGADGMMLKAGGAGCLGEYRIRSLELSTVFLAI